MTEKPSLIVYASLKSADLSSEGELILVLEKNQDVQPSTTTLCKLIRQFFQEKNVYLYITLLNEKEELI